MHGAAFASWSLHCRVVVRVLSLLTLELVRRFAAQASASCSAQRAHLLVSPLYRRGAYANVLPRHGLTLTVEWTFS